jgi:hypothetical protein
MMAKVGIQSHKLRRCLEQSKNMISKLSDEVLAFKQPHNDRSIHGSYIQRLFQSVQLPTRANNDAGWREFSLFFFFFFIPDLTSSHDHQLLNGMSLIHVLNLFIICSANSLIFLIVKGPIKVDRNFYFPVETNTLVFCSIYSDFVI